MSEKEVVMAVPAAKSSGVVVPHQAKWRQRLAAALVYGLIRSLAATLRFRWRDESGLFTGEPEHAVIFSIWHNRLALSLVIYRLYVQRRQRSRRLAAMVSASRDGGLLARILEHFGVEPVRGSSSRRGPQALRELTTWSERGCNLAITPDGPRGPCYVVQDGVTALAQLSGLPIVPVSYHLSWKIRSKSWDRFQVPLPFAGVEVRLGAPIRVPPEASHAERERLRLQLENAMKAITRD
ncbi:MAG: lysophospholipid acyltransferase family protein [Limisphaerales bacterium]